MAIQRITSRIIEDGAIEVADVADNAVTTAKIADGNVTAAKIDTVANTQVTGTMTTAQVADSAITTDKLADANVTIGKIATTVPLGTKNLIINGDMRIAQRGTSVSGITTSSGVYYSIDRFGQWLSGAGTWTHAQDTDVPSGQGFANSLKLSCTTANASLSSGSYYHTKYTIEAQNLQHLKYGTANAESITYSFWVKSNKTGTYIVEIEQDDSLKVISQSYTINTANTWEKKTLTFIGNTADIINNDNGRGLHIWHWLAAGSGFTSGTLNTSWSARTSANDAVGQVNLADSTSNYINITGVQLEVGDTATPFEHRPYDMELARCQRYFTVLGGGVYTPIGIGASSTTTSAYVNVSLPVAMRATPTLGSFSNLIITDRQTYDLTVTSLGTAVGGVQGMHLFVNHNATSVINRPAMFNVSGAASGFLQFISEL